VAYAVFTQVEALKAPQTMEGLIGDLTQLVGSQVQVAEVDQWLEDAARKTSDLVL
jgi:hypothetical protein